MALVFGAGFYGHLHPPAAAPVAAPEGQLVVHFLKIHDVFGQPVGGGGEVSLSVVEAVQEVPGHLGSGGGSLAVDVQFLAETVNPEGFEFIAHAGVAGHLAGLLRGEPAGGGVFLARRFALFQGREVEAQEVAVADERLQFGWFCFGLAEAHVVEVPFVEVFEGFGRDEVALAADEAQVEQAGVLAVEDFPEEVFLLVFAVGAVRDALVDDGQADQLLQALEGFVLCQGLPGGVAEDERENLPVQQLPDEGDDKRYFRVAHVAQVGHPEAPEGKAHAVELPADGVRVLLSDADDGHLRFPEVGQFPGIALYLLAELVGFQGFFRISERLQPVLEHGFVDAFV